MGCVVIQILWLTQGEGNARDDIRLYILTTAGNAARRSN